MKTFADFYEGDPITTARDYRAGHRDVVALKVSEGNRADSTFHGRWQAFGGVFRFGPGGLVRRRIYRMPYTYCHPHLHAPGATVLFALTQVHAAGGFRHGADLPLCIDVEITEGLTPSQLLAWIEEAAAVAHHFTGRGLILYIPGWMALQLPRAPRGATVLWIPGYPYLPHYPVRWGRLFGHQFTDHAWPVEGSARPCDLSNLYMDPRELTIH